MTFRITKIMVVSLLCSAAMIPSSMAHEAEAPAGGTVGEAEAVVGEATGAECDELQVLVDETAGVIEQWWLDGATAIAEGDNVENCAAWVNQARITLEGAETGGTAETLEGRIVVSQPEPEVSVLQAAPQVSVTQPQPQVQVRQGQPEIIVRMPEPEVVVTQAEPQVQMAEEGEELGEGAGIAERELLTAPALEREGFEMVEHASISAEELQEAEVYGVDDREIASVDSVELDESGQIQYFVMDVGGFLGLGARNVAVGFDEATIVRDEGGEHHIYIEATQEQLENLPEHHAMTTE